MNVILSSQYFPPISYFSYLLNAENAFIDIKEPYRKQTYRSRTTILTSQGPQALSIPIQKKGQRSMKLCKVSYAENWQKNHLKSIETAYGKSPFFEHFYPYLEQFYTKKIELLTDLNSECLTMCLKFLNIKKGQLNFSDQPEINALDLRESLSPKNQSLIINDYAYHQMFGNEFAKDLSILDVLFCEGPIALDIIKHQVKIKTD